MKYKTCPYCGDRLDFGEICDCRKQEANAEKGVNRRAVPPAMKGGGDYGSHLEATGGRVSRDGYRAAGMG